MKKKLKAESSKLKAETKKNNGVEEYSVSLEELLEAGTHFGHQARRWNPKMAPFIYTTRDGVHIFDLAQTSQRLAQASLAAKKMVGEGKIIVLVGTKRQAQAIIKEEAGKYGIPFIATRWLGGTISNWEQIFKSIKKLLEMKEKRQKGEYVKYTKKENLLLDREIARLERFFGGIASLTQPPDALFVVDTNREATALAEARTKGIKIFAIVDSNSDADLVDYPIPGNDDAVRSIKLIVSTFAKAVGEGMELAKKMPVKIEK